MVSLKRLGFAVLLAAVALGAAPPQAGAQDRPPDWLKKPSMQDLMGVWPVEAMRTGQGGKATISCAVTVQGALRDCRIVSESPARQGFGSAGLTLTPQLVMRPALKDGKPVESRVAIPITWPSMGRPTGSNIPGPGPLAGIPERVISGVRWSQAPSVSDVLAAYPEKARRDKVGGRATLDCVLTKTGAINHCHILQEEPSLHGFGGAALRLSKTFVGPTADGAGAPLVGVHVQVPFVFAAEMLESAAPVIGKPQWTALPRGADLVGVYPPEAAKAGILKARVVLTCAVAPGGALADCAVASEEPGGYGLGKATVGLAGTFRLSVWSVEGLPTVGGTVRVPIRFDLTDAPPAPAKP